LEALDALEALDLKGMTRKFTGFNLEIKDASWF
jgi:hypothetical protein